MVLVWRVSAWLVLVPVLVVVSAVLVAAGGSGSAHVSRLEWVPLVLASPLLVLSWRAFLSLVELAR